MGYASKSVSKLGNRSIGTVFMYEKCMIVSHGLGIGFGTLSEKRDFLEYVNIWISG